MADPVSLLGTCTLVGVNLRRPLAGRARRRSPAPDSPLVKLLKSGRVPEARQGAIVEMIGKRGTAGDVEFLFQKATSPDGFPAPCKLKALEALAEAAANRNLRPTKDVDKLAALIRSASPRSDPAIEKAAVRLAGLWKLEAAAGPLKELAVSPSGGRRRFAAKPWTPWPRSAAGSDDPRSRRSRRRPCQSGTRIQAVASLARLDVDAAAARAAEILAAAPAAGARPRTAPGRLLEPARRRGRFGRRLSIGTPRPPTRPGWRCGPSTPSAGPTRPWSPRSLARPDSPPRTKPLTPAELNQLVAEVAAHGDPARGESIFRRADLNCMSCHSLSKAGGEVGPDLSATRPDLAGRLHHQFDS